MFWITVESVVTKKNQRKKNKKNKKYEIWCALLFVMYFSTFPRVFELSSGISQYCLIGFSAKPTRDWIESQHINLRRSRFAFRKKTNKFDEGNF